MSQNTKHDSFVEKAKVSSGNEDSTRPPSTTNIVDFAPQEALRPSTSDSQKTALSNDWTNMLAGTDYTRFAPAPSQYAHSLGYDSNESSQQLAMHCGGSHLQNDIKLPGYWSHERSSELREQAERQSATTSSHGTAARENVIQIRDKQKGKGKTEKIEGQRGGKTESFLKSILRRKA